MVKLADEYSIALQAVIDPNSTSLQTSIENLSKTLKPIELKINTSNVESKLKSIKTQIESLSKMTINLGQGRGRGGVSSTSVSQQTQAYRELLSVVSQIDRVNMKTSGMKANGIDVSKQVQQIKEYRTEFERLTGELSKPNISKDTFKSLQEQISTLKSQVISLNTELSKVYSKQQGSKATKIGDGGISDLRLADARNALGNDIDVWLQQNSAAAKTFGARLQEIKAQIQSADATQLQHLRREFQDVTKQAQLAGVAGKTMGDQFKQSLKTVTSYFSAAMLITRTISVMRNMYNEVLKVDTAMTGLRRVTNLTGEQYQKMYDDMTTSAKKYGATLTDIIDLTTSWVKLGFDSNVSARLAEITTMYQHVADLDTSTATENLVSTFKGFQKSLDESMGGDVAKEVEYIADVFDKLNNEYAVTAADVGAALQRSAASLQFANNTLQESSGLVVGMNEILQNAEKTGTILNTTALRLMGAKGKLEELGEEVDENIESITKLQTHVLNLTHGKVNIFNDDKSFKSTYQILKEIAAVYEELSDVEAADLLETIAGKRNANGIAAVLQNWKQVESAMQSATTASGTASAENQKYMESLAGKIEATRAAWQALANSFLSSDFLKGLIDTGNSFFSILNSIVSKTGALPPLLAIIFGYLSASKNIGRDKRFSLNSSNMPIVVIVLFGYGQFRYYQC